MSGHIAYSLPPGVTPPPFAITFCNSGKHWIRLGEKECLKCLRKQELQELLDDNDKDTHHLLPSVELYHCT